MTTATSVHQIKGAYDRLVGRVAGMKKRAEAAAGATQQVLLTNAGTAAFAWANETYGNPPANDASGFRELDVMGAPVDLASGLAGVGLAMFGMFGKFDDAALSLANGGLNSFTYRFVGEWARMRRAAAPATATSGTRAMGPGGWPQAGAQRARSHAYAPAP